MVDYGQVTRENHAKKRELSKEYEKTSCTFSPLLISNRFPNEKIDIDRGLYMYERAMAGSKLIAKHRCDKDPLELDVEKNGGECSF